MSADRLAVGDRIRCLHCPDWHSAERSPSDAGTDYARRMLYVRCRGDVYYAGQAGLPARDPCRIMSVPNMRKDHDTPEL